ncbi:MAG: cadherin-like domain-containing protein [Hyphomicrobium sp.]
MGHELKTVTAKSIGSKQRLYSWEEPAGRHLTNGSIAMLAAAGLSLLKQLFGFASAGDTTGTLGSDWADDVTRAALHGQSQADEGQGDLETAQKDKKDGELMPQLKSLSSAPRSHESIREELDLPRANNDNSSLNLPPEVAHGSHGVAIAHATDLFRFSQIPHAVSEGGGGGSGGSASNASDGEGTRSTAPKNTDGSASIEATPESGKPIKDQEQQSAPSAQRNTAPTLLRSVVLPDMYINHAVLIGLAQLLQHASDVEGDHLTISDLSVSSGAIYQHDDETWVFAPTVDDTGTVTFSYFVTDGDNKVAQVAQLEVVPDHVIEPEEGEAGIAPIGTASSDVIFGTYSSDDIDATADDDIVFAGAGGDMVNGGDGNDIIDAGDGDDIVQAGNGDDVVFAGAGDDLVFAGGGNDIVHGGLGDDVVFGGSGNDTFVAGTQLPQSGDATQISDGNDLFDGGEGVDTYDGSAIHSDITVDLLAGEATGSEIGNDRLIDVENVIAGDGNDLLIDNQSTNTFTGGPGNDTFAFTGHDSDAGNPETMDKITDFESGDKIDVSRIDAYSESPEVQLFKFIGQLLADNDISPISLGALGFKFELKDDGEHTIVWGHRSDAGSDDLWVDLLGEHDLKSDDFYGVS